MGVFSDKGSGRVLAGRPGYLYRADVSSETPGRRHEAAPRDKISVFTPPTRHLAAVIRC